MRPRGSSHSPGPGPAIMMPAGEAPLIRRCLIHPAAWNESHRKLRQYLNPFILVALRNSAGQIPRSSDGGGTQVVLLRRRLSLVIAAALMLVMMMFAAFGPVSERGMRLASPRPLPQYR